ncbi:uncharacterized protein METZ01_LOCUS42916 [marine metagenome]|uniref:VWFA domain-containing protein n=1 Tax=marine metagenome TaxID=408172 RepID=A0A381RE47_9ZZZZ
MNYYKQPSYTSYVKGISNFIQRIKRKNIDFEIYSFGSQLDKLLDITKIKTDANSTNIGLVFENLDVSYEKNIAGAIIFTDGQINQGPLLSKFSTYNKLPIHIVGIGDTIPMLDVSIKSVDIPPISVKGKEVNIDATITSVGNLKERVNVTLFDENNKLIGSKIIKISGKESLENVRFQIKPNKIGKNSYLIKCSALSDEINIQNNQQKIIMHVMKDRYNVALITGAPNYNTRLLKDHLSRSNNNIDHFVYINDKFNPQIKEFWKKKYEVIIFDNNPIKPNSEKWDSLVRIFTKKLISHNSSFLIIPGPEIDINSINNYLKIIDIEAKELISNDQNQYKWGFTSQWLNNFSFNNSKWLDNDVSSMPQQNPAFYLGKQVNDKNTNFAEYIGVDRPNPLLILGEKKSIRYAIWNSIDIASIKYKLLNTNNSFVLDNSLNKIFNWLMKKSGSQEYVFRTNKNSYQQGEEVLLSGRSLNYNDDIIHEGTVELYYNDKFIGSKPLFLDINKNEYKSRFWAPKPGKIKYIVNINKGIDSYEVSNGTFEVQESHIELNRIFLNKEKLINISRSSGGTFNYWMDYESLLDEINIVNKKENYIATYIIRHNYLFISIILLILTIEWLLRRRMGLM